MSDLISRSALMESLIHCDGLGRKSLEAVIKTIKEQPTAYDVDKVVEELEDKMLTSSSASAEAIMEMCGVSATFYNGEYEAYKHAIEIVRGGGVNERN